MVHRWCEVPAHSQKQIRAWVNRSATCNAHSSNSTLLIRVQYQALVEDSLDNSSALHSRPET